jgi:iron complex transport system permease protein
MLGAAAAAILVYSLGSVGRSGTTPVRLLLAGVAVTSVLGGIGTSITLLNPSAFDNLRVWSIGALAGRDITVVEAAAPFIIVGLAIALLISPALNAIAIGDDHAHALGTKVVRTRLLAAISITLLAGAGTAAVGPIGFIGLMTPHVVRALLGADQRRIIAGSMIFAPILLLAADILGRELLAGELEAGIVTAFIGAPILIFLVRRRKVGSI